MLWSVTKVPTPAERTTTIRVALREELLKGPATLRDLSQRLGVSEKELPDHLEHLEKSTKGRGEKLRQVPPECLGCGYVFADRTRVTRPGKCPQCRSERIDPPTFWIQGSDAQNDTDS
jgi:predicted Zn-ribbon and HTH transcriptional regulator